MVQHKVRSLRKIKKNYGTRKKMVGGNDEHTLNSDECKQLENSILILTDSYKFSHYSQYPVIYKDNDLDTENTKPLSINKIDINDTYGAYNISYFEARGSKFKLGNRNWNKVAFFGLQYYIKKYLEGPIIKEPIVNIAEKFVNGNVAENVFPKNDWKAIAAGSGSYGKRYGGTSFDNKYGFTEEYKVEKGNLPVIIEALQEGTVIDVSKPLFKITNTHPRFYWLPNYLETLLVQVWYSMTVCTSTFAQRCLLNYYTGHAGTDLDTENAPQIKLDAVDLLDFGFRGVSSVETATLGSLSYLAAGFIGSDTPVGVPAAIRYYNANEHYKSKSSQGYHAQFIGSGVPASEHSTITSWSNVTDDHNTFTMRERYAWMNQLIQYGLKGLNMNKKDNTTLPSSLTQFHTVSFVIDGYNTWNAIYNQFFSTEKVEIKNDKGESIGMYSMLDCIERFFANALSIAAPPGLIVLRPDSGDANLVLPIIAKLLVAALNKKDSDGNDIITAINYPSLNIIKEQINDQINKNLSVNFKVIKQTKDTKSYFPFGFVILQGDGVEPAKLPCYLDTINYNGFAVGTFRFGSGGGLLQKINRDTFKCAFKCCAMAYPDPANPDSGELKVVGVQKNPLTSIENREDYKITKIDGSPKTGKDFGGDKKSKSGWLNVIVDNDGTYTSVDLEKRKQLYNSPDLLLKPVFINGTLVKANKQTFLDVRTKINENLLLMKNDIQNYTIQDKTEQNFTDLKSILRDIKSEKTPSDISLYLELANLGSKWFDIEVNERNKIFINKFQTVFNRASTEIYEPKNIHKDCGSHVVESHKTHPKVTTPTPVRLTMRGGSSHKKHRYHKRVKSRKGRKVMTKRRRHKKLRRQSKRRNGKK